MKVGNTSEIATAAVSSTRPVGEGDRQAQVRNDKAPSSNAASQSSTVNLSRTAQVLTADGAGADFDAGKVSQIKSSIEQGTYQVNHQAIADKLIANAQELLGKSSG
jgi:negative regulator of flagellin synthesis FlgM